MLYPCAHWGAYVVGSDIDGRQMRGKGHSLVHELEPYIEPPCFDTQLTGI